jgi:hypothetical protein
MVYGHADRTQGLFSSSPSNGSPITTNSTGGGSPNGGTRGDSS